MFSKTGEKVINWFDDYPRLVSKAKYEAKDGKGLTTLSPKQIL